MEQAKQRWGLRGAWLVLLVMSLTGGCSSVSTMTRRGAPPNPGCCAGSVWASGHLFVLYAKGTRAKSYHPTTDHWRDEVAIPRGVGDPLSVAGVLVGVRNGVALIYDRKARHWQRVPGPTIDGRTAVQADRGHVLVRPSHGGLSGGAILDVAARRWFSIPGGPGAPPPRYAQWRVVGDTLVWLPGHVGVPTDVRHPGATWKLGAPAWQPMNDDGPKATRPEDTVAVVDNVVLIQEAAATRWWRYDLGGDRWSRIDESGAPKGWTRAFVAGRSVLVVGSGAAIYDVPGGTWTAADMPPRATDYLLSAEDGRVVLLDGGKRPESVFDIRENRLLPVDVSGFPDRSRRFTMREWSGRCLLLWGEVIDHSAKNQCRNAPPGQGCDPVPGRVDYRNDGKLWCLPPSGR